MQEMDPLDLLFERLVRAVRDKRPEFLTRPFEVAELIELVPYRSVRAEGAVETNDDYSHALTRLLAGERGYVFADDLLQDDLRAELSSPNPDLAAWRAYTTSRVTISQEHARKAGESMPPAAAPASAPGQRAPGRRGLSLLLRATTKRTGPAKLAGPGASKHDRQRALTGPPWSPAPPGSS
jgi:hypothetical protein